MNSSPPPNPPPQLMQRQRPASYSKRYSTAGSINSVTSGISGLYSQSNSSGGYLGLGLTHTPQHHNTLLSHSSAASSNSTSASTTLTAPPRRVSERFVSRKSSTSSLTSTQIPPILPPNLPLPSPRERATSEGGASPTSPFSSPRNSFTGSSTSAKTAVNRNSTSSPLLANGRSPSALASRTSSRLQKRPGSRAASMSLVNPALVRIQNNKVEELKYKIAELEEVLQREKVDRQLAASRFDQIRILEAALDRERQEKHQLELKLQEKEQSSVFETSDERSSEDEGQLSPTTPTVSSMNKSSPDFSTGNNYSYSGNLSEIIPNPINSEEALRIEDYRRSVYSKESIDDIMTGLPTDSIRLVMSEKESKLLEEQKSDTDLSTLVRLQTDISVLTSDNRALKNEKANFLKLLKEKDEELKRIRLEMASNESARTKLDDRVAELQLELTAWKDKSYSTEREKLAKDMIFKDELLKTSTLAKRLEERENEVKELKIKIAVEMTARETLKDDVERIVTERDELQHQVLGFKTGRKQVEAKVVTLEKEARRSKRVINALETSLQDLKVSLEEKAMENDELNRSILKVMEQANETIEGAKRHSLAPGSPPMEDLFRRRSDLRSSISSRLSQVSQFSGSSLG